MFLAEAESENLLKKKKLIWHGQNDKGFKFQGDFFGVYKESSLGWSEIFTAEQILGRGSNEHCVVATELFLREFEYGRPWRVRRRDHTTAAVVPIPWVYLFFYIIQSISDQVWNGIEYMKRVKHWMSFVGTDGINENETLLECEFWTLRGLTSVTRVGLSSL